jgi:membrane protease YdiL (CAAX protease family)
VERAEIDPTPPPPAQPELPEGAQPRWLAWYAGVGFLVALISTVLVVGILDAAIGQDAGEDPAFTVGATFLQGVIFIGTAVLVTVQPDAEQTVVEDLGADESTLGLIAAGFMVICVAPVAEEFFFRGFFYRALRSRWSVPVAALIDGLLFGVIHFDFSGADALLIVPPLAALGFMFCLVLERTGSLYPVIALHAFNNAIAYGAAVEDASVSLVLGPVMLAACALVPRAQRTAMA